MTVHMVGSVNLADAESVFRAASSALGDEVPRIPDGETDRSFGQWMMPTILAHPAISATEHPNPAFRDLIPQLNVSADFDGPIELSDFGIAKAATESYALFSRLKREGVVPARARFQMGAPTPTTLAALGEISSQQRLAKDIETAIIRELETTSAAIPHDELAVQFELPGEVGILEGVFPWWRGTELDPITEEVARMAAAVPPDVELGIHLCYGDPQPPGGDRGEHWADPKDLSLLVRIANAIAVGMGRPLNFVHMPVPMHRDDQGFFRPLRDLRLPSETKLYLGLIHDEDGLEGSKRRIEAAKTAYQGFGVATECGMGRVPSDVIPGLLDLHRAASQTLAQV